MSGLRTAALATSAWGLGAWGLGALRGFAVLGFGALGAGLGGCGTAECPAGTALREGRCLETDASVPSMDAARRADADLDAPTFFVATPAGGGAARFMQEVDCE
jgi:hypothetical protein